MHFKDLTPPGTTEGHLNDTNKPLLDHSWTMNLLAACRPHLALFLDLASGAEPIFADFSTGVPQGLAATTDSFITDAFDLEQCPIPAWRLIAHM
jgi:hypothetical protein